MAEHDRAPITCRRGVRGVALQLLLLLVLAPASAAADTVVLLETEWSAAVERARLVLEARESVDVAAFIVGGEPFSLTSMALLRDAADRGVRVRLLLDSQWNKLPPAVEAHLLHRGVEIRLYHPATLCRLDWVTRRMHDKLLIVDAQSLIVGGRNIESTYYALGHQVGRRNYLDTDVLLDGTVAADAAVYFEAMWTSGEVRQSKVLVAPRARNAAGAELDGHFQWLVDRVAEEKARGNAHPPPDRDVGAVRFLFDPPGLKGKAPGVAEALLALLDAATDEVVIESPYLVPTEGFRAGLLRARDRGVRVRIVTNSLASTDNIWPQAGYVGERKWLVENGVELWEYLGPESLHGKTAVFDGRTAVVGSFNLDPRSQSLNTEVAVVLDDPQWAAVLLGVMDDRRAGAVRIDERGRPVGYEERYPNSSCPKIFALQLARLLAPLIRSQL